MNLYIKEIIKRFLKIFLKNTIIKVLFNDKVFPKIIQIFPPEELNESSNMIVTFKFKKKYHFINKEDCINYANNSDKVGIVLQGPLKKEDKFTYNTIRNYLHVIKADAIVVSTWNDEDIEYVNEIKDLGVKVILNEKPDKSGFSNINYQILSTFAGIKYLKENGFTYVAKTRTDSRLERANALQVLIILLKNYKLSKLIKEQKERIVLIDFNTKLNVPFCISDIFQFGNIEDMYKMWNVELDKRENTYDFKVLRDYDPVQIFNLEAAENYLMRRFMEGNGLKYEFDLNGYYKILAERFIIVDQNQIGHYWYKRFNTELPYTPNFVRGLASFSDWLMLHNMYNKD